MEEKVFIGYGYGRFENNQGQMQDYCNVFMLEDFNGTQNADYHFGGQKAVKYRCVNPKVWGDITVGTRVMVSFDSKQRISYMVPVEA